MNFKAIENKLLSLLLVKLTVLTALDTARVSSPTASTIKKVDMTSVYATRIAYDLLTLFSFVEENKEYKAKYL